MRLYWVTNSASLHRSIHAPLLRPINKGNASWKYIRYGLRLGNPAGITPLNEVEARKLCVAGFHRFCPSLIVLLGNNLIPIWELKQS